MNRRGWVVGLVVIAACKRPHEAPPSPLGTLSAWQLPLWQAECSTPLAATRVCGRFPPEPCDALWHSIWPAENGLKDDRPGASATRKVTCASEGWGVWTDDLHRVVAVCVADPTTTDESVRLHEFIARHTDDRSAERVWEVIHDDKHPSGWRWFEAWNMIPKPDSMGKQACFEVRLEH